MPFPGGIEATPNGLLLLSVVAAVLYCFMAHRPASWRRTVAKTAGVTLLGLLSYAAGGPLLLFFHGGAWILGFKQYQALPMMHRLAAAGWICMSFDYRLSPRATFPDHLIDVKHAIAWAKEHAADYGGDASFVAVSGNSAGAHLASLAALTWDDATLQPGFEDEDTSVDAVVSYYGVMDLRRAVEAHQNEGLRLLLERAAVKQPFERAQGLYVQLDPLSQVHADPPPILMVHGLHDRMVHVRDSEQLCARLREAGATEVHLLSVPYVAHAFDQAPTPAQQRAQRLVLSFLDRQWERHRATIGI